MPWIHFEDVSVDLDTLEVRSFTCHKEFTAHVCGRVVSKDGRFDQVICTTIHNAHFVREAWRRAKERILRDYCEGADNPEMCEEYYDDMAGEMACEHLSIEEVEESMDRMLVAEALAEAAEDYLPPTPRGLLKWMKR